MPNDVINEFRAGQCWRYRAPAGFENSRILIGAIVSFADTEAIVCCAVTSAPRLLPDGRIDAIGIPFLPMTAQALSLSVMAPDGDGDLAPDFGPAFQQWHDDPRGYSAFTVPFEGRLDLMIAAQMAQIVGHSID